MAHFSTDLQTLRNHSDPRSPGKNVKNEVKDKGNPSTAPMPAGAISPCSTGLVYRLVGEDIDGLVDHLSWESRGKVIVMTISWQYN